MRGDTPVIAEGLFSYQIGGSERVGVDLAMEFSRRGYQVVCFAFYDSDGPMRAELERAGIRCLDMNYERLSGLSRRVNYKWKFLRMLRAERVSALHVHHATALILAGIPAWLARMNRVVMTEHGLYQLQERPRYRRSAARYCRYATDITVVEPAQAAYFHSELKVPQKRLHYVPNGVRIARRSTELVAQARARLGVPDDTFAYFFVGRLSPVKDLGTLLSAFSELPRDVSDRAKLFLVGEGSERTTLEAKRDTLGLDNRVQFLGARDDIAEVLMAADAFVMSSTTEGLPMALLEAMAAGVPCAATGVGGIPELFENSRGLIAPPGDHRSLAEAMTRLARSPELREVLAANAMENVRRRYALDAAVDQYLMLLGLPPRAT